MSFGVGVGDFIAVSKQFVEFRDRFKEAPARLRHFTETLESIGHVVEEIRDFVEEKCLAPEQETELSSISRALKREMVDIDDLLQGFAILDPASPRPNTSFWRIARREAQKTFKKLQWDLNKDQYQLSRLNTYLDNWKEFRDKVNRQRAERDAVLDWIRPPEHLSFDAPRIHDRAGRWLLESNVFQSWAAGQGCVLLCHGIPGAGKTTMASIIARSLRKEKDGDPTNGIVDIYCDFGRHEDQTYRNLLSNLLFQLAQIGPRVPSNLTRLYNRHKTNRTKPSEDELSKELEIVVSGFSKVFIILDALDECQGCSRAHLLAKVHSMQARYDINLLATSRHRNALAEFEQCQLLEIRAKEEDVRGYLDANMQCLRLNPLPPNLEEKIKTEIIKAIDGMFLLSKIYLNSLSGAKSPKHAEKMLRELPTGSNAPEKAYDNIIKRIKEQGSEQIAIPALKIVANVKRPLSRRELQHAMAVESNTNELDEYNFSHVDEIISACAGFLSVDEENDRIRLVHRTMHQYLQQLDWFHDAEKDLAEICLTYLSFNTFEDGPCSADEEFEEKLNKHAFYDYAARYWGKHVQKASIETDNKVLGFLQSQHKVRASSQVMLVKKAHAWRGYSQRVAGNVTGLHLASYFGLSDTVQRLLTFGADGKSADSRGRTPLSWAAECGHETTVQVLLRTGKGVNCPDFFGRNELFWAAQYGHRATVVLLLNYITADIKIQDGSGRTALSWAAGNGHIGVVQALLDTDLVNVDLTDDYGRSPLSWAVEKGDRDIVELLLNTGKYEVDLKDNSGRTAFSRAAESGSDAILKLLLVTQEVNADAKDTDGRTPLSWAAESGHETVVELLLGTEGVDMLSTDKDGRTAFSWAVGSGQLRTAQMFLKATPTKADFILDSPDNFGWTPLLWAAQDGHARVVEWLIETGKISVSRPDANGRNAFLWASRNGHEATVELLLRRTIQYLDLKDVNGRTALSWAAGEGNAGVVQLLLDTGVDIDSMDNRRRTPLSWAAENGFLPIVDLLLRSAQVDADSMDKDERSPLSWAAENGNEEVARLLIATDAVDVYSRDKRGRTPLMLAAANGYDRTVEVIIIASKDGIDVTDRRGQTAFSWAKEGGYDAVIELLRLHA